MMPEYPLFVELKSCDGQWRDFNYCWFIAEGKCTEYKRPWWAFFSKVCTKWDAGYFPNRLTIPVAISR